MTQETLCSIAHDSVGLDILHVRDFVDSEGVPCREYKVVYSASGAKFCTIGIEEGGKAYAWGHLDSEAETAERAIKALKQRLAIYRRTGC